MSLAQHSAPSGISPRIVRRSIYRHTIPNPRRVLRAAAWFPLRRHPRRIGDQPEPSEAMAIQPCPSRAKRWRERLMPTREGEDASGIRCRRPSPKGGGLHTGTPARAAKRRSPPASGDWRRERDSNPRYGFPYTRFPSVRLKPLGHLSVRAGLTVYRRAGTRSTAECRVRGPTPMARAVLRRLCHVALEASFHGLFPESPKGRPRHSVAEPLIRGQHRQRPAIVAHDVTVRAIARTAQSISSSWNSGGGLWSMWRTC